MNSFKYLISSVILTLAICSSSCASDDFAGMRANKLIKSCNKALERAQTMDEKADLLISLKLDLNMPLSKTQALSDEAIKLYKIEERRLSIGFDPFTTYLDYYNTMSIAAFREYYVNFIDVQLEEHEKLLRLRKISLIYQKMADVYAIDGKVKLADQYYILSSRLLVDGLYDYSDTSYTLSTLRQAVKILKKTTLYRNKAKPLLSWCMDIYKTRDFDLANRVVDAVLCSNIESPAASDIFKAAYFSLLHGDLVLAVPYYTYGKSKFSCANPMNDSNVSSRTERFANLIATEFLDTLLKQEKLETNSTELAKKLNVAKLVKFHKPLATVFGSIEPEYLDDSERLFNRIRALHVDNVEKMAML